MLSVMQLELERKLRALLTLCLDTCTLVEIILAYVSDLLACWHAVCRAA
jgi:hypothetical protein